MKVLIERAIILNAYASTKNNNVYVDVRSPDGEFTVTVPSADVESLNKHRDTMQTVEIQTRLRGSVQRIYKDGKFSGKSQNLTAITFAVKPVA